MALIGTLGMFIIDTFSFYDPDNPEAEPTDRGLGKQLGGGGTYFIVGSRVFCEPQHLLMVIDRGQDFPQEAQQNLDRFASTPEGTESGAMWKFRDREGDVKTTMAVNIYRGEHRGFEYLTPKQRLDPPDLVTESSSSSLPQFLHCICSPERAMQIFDQVEELGRNNASRTKIVWEPIPDSAKPENLATCIKVMERIDVFSPNHEEAAAFLGVSSSSLKGESISQTKDHLASLLASEFSKKCEKPIVCIRSGALGSVIGREDLGWRWVEAWHSSETQDRVVDVTGAGNGFLGGLTACLAQSAALGSPEWTLDRLEEAAIWGSVSASFIVEQLGLPTISDTVGTETWNGDSAWSRVEVLKQRMRKGRSREL